MEYNGGNLIVLAGRRGEEKDIHASAQWFVDTPSLPPLAVCKVDVSKSLSPLIEWFEILIVGSTHHHFPATGIPSVPMRPALLTRP